MNTSGNVHNFPREATKSRTENSYSWNKYKHENQPLSWRSGRGWSGNGKINKKGDLPTDTDVFLRIWIENSTAISLTMKFDPRADRCSQSIVESFSLTSRSVSRNRHKNAASSACSPSIATFWKSRTFLLLLNSDGSTHWIHWQIVNPELYLRKCYTESILELTVTLQSVPYQARK